MAEQDDRLDGLIAQADPAIAVSVSDRAVRELVHEARVLSVRRRNRFAALAGGAVVAVVAGTAAIPATADLVRDFIAQSGFFCGGAETECTTGDQWIRLDAPDLDEVVGSLYPSYLELPPGTTRDDAIEYASRPVADTLVTETAIVWNLEYFGYCSWLGAWLEADQRGDAHAAAAALDVIRSTGAWPATVATDVDGGVVEQREAVAVLAASGNRSQVDRERQRSCEIELRP